MPGKNKLRNSLESAKPGLIKYITAWNPLSASSVSENVTGKEN